MTNLVRNFPKEFMIPIPPFAFTSATGGLSNIDINKLDYFLEMEDVINKLLLIKNYTSVINDIVFCYLLFDRSKINMPNRDYISRLLPKTKSLEVGLNLDFTQFHIATELETQQIMIDKFLWGIENLLSKRKDFDYRKFYADCKNILYVDSAINDSVLCMV